MGRRGSSGSKPKKLPRLKPQFAGIVSCQDGFFLASFKTSENSCSNKGAAEVWQMHKFAHVVLWTLISSLCQVKPSPNNGTAGSAKSVKNTHQNAPAVERHPKLAQHDDTPSPCAICSGLLTWAVKESADSTAQRALPLAAADECSHVLI